MTCVQRSWIAAGGATAGLLGVSWQTALQLALGVRRVGRWRRLICHNAFAPPELLRRSL